MKKVILISLVFASTYLNGQDSDIATEVLDSLYSRAIDGRIDLMLQGGPIFFEQNEVTARIENNVGHFKFLNDSELIQESLDRKRTVNAIRTVHKVISQDTIDVNFGTVGVTAKRQIHFYKGLRFKKANFAVSCGGTNGYQPDFRFVLNSNGTWELLTNRFLDEMNKADNSR
ncbi:hypothetical protein AAOE16_18055 [Ekhidna sp. MALMAid0563]|uniref:hypothetical protein n=1 Tax=Ekhidna sp. MALMAid0563 TaxID=3143937 RepID=UPI0032DEA16D